MPRRTPAAAIDHQDGSPRLTAEYVTARVLLDAASIEEAASGILQAICQSLAWEHGAYWTVDEEAECLRCAQMWCASPSRFAEFHAISAGMTFRPGIGLPGRVWVTAAPAWIPDVVADANFPRAPIAAQEGLHAAFGFPILLRGTVLGVMEFFSREILAPDEHLIPMLTTIGHQIGLFFERQRAQLELSRFFTLALDMLCVIGADGYFKRVNPAWRNTLGYTDAELLSRPYIEFVHPDDVALTREAATRLFAGQPLASFEHRMCRSDGTPRWMAWAAAPPQKGQDVVYAAARDVTERKVAEELRARNASLELLDELLATVTDSGELPDVFGRVSEIAHKVLPHDALGLPVLLPDGRHARAYASTGIEGVQTFESVDVPERYKRTDWEYDLIHDLSLEREAHNKVAADLGFRSLIRVPIRLDGRPTAALVFLARAANAFTASDILIARRIAGRIAMKMARDREHAAAQRADEAAERAARLESRVQALTEELDARTGYRRVVGNSREWRQVLTQATQVAATDSTVLLLGESGTGKEVVARFVHRGSNRKNGPFVALNCAALPEQLLEAELFGYERGAYTGAVQSKPGRLEQAAGGTLFLDEVGEMSLPAQAKFLRVLQEREFQRLGATRVLRSDARVVAATNRDLQRAIANGQFREDLYYRLHVFPIHLPPLRGRRDDILALSDAFLTEIGRGLGRPSAGISRDGREMLVAYHWPGNVRELRNILERASILCDGGLITAEHLALNVGSVPASASSPPPVPTAFVAVPAPASPSPGPPARDLQTMERTLIEQALKKARFNKSKAAQALGLTRRQLYVRMQKYGLE
jgi:PAS domain S-box-containing protein